MSYDLHLFHVLPGEDANAAAEASLDADEESALGSGPPDPGAELRNQALATRAREVNPEMCVAAFDFAKIARLEGITEREARRRYRHLELDAGEGGPGVQIMLHDRTASLTVPYWHHGPAARAVWEEIWAYLRVFSQDGGYTIYDPQLGRVLDLSADLPAVLASYADGVGYTDGVRAQITEPHPRRRWWKFR